MNSPTEKIGDLFCDMYALEEHPITLMREYGIRCEALASCPLADAWFIWGARWSCVLPKGFAVKNLSRQRETPYYQYGMFINGLNGSATPLNDDLCICLTNRRQK